MTLADYYRRYRNSMVKLTVADANGDQQVGAGFHIGDGWVVTAKHNLETNKLIHASIELTGQALTFGEQLSHEDPAIDLLVLKCIEADSFSSSIKIGTHLDDWIKDEFLLSKILIMGFPRIPFTEKTFLVCAEAEVNAVVRLLTIQAIHFVLSSTARGGLSGGPAITDEGELLGVITSSLMSDNEHETTGFCVALSVQPLFQILRQLTQRPPFVPKDIWSTLS